MISITAMPHKGSHYSPASSVVTDKTEIVMLQQIAFVVIILYFVSLT